MKNYKKSLAFSYAIGVYPTLELLAKYPKQTTKILLHSKGGKNAGIQKIKDLAAQYRIPTKVSDHEIYSITRTENTYALAAFQKYDSTLSTGNHLLLVNPSDAGNLGTIIRTMLAFGYSDLAIINPGVDHFDPKVIRASMGAIFSIQVARFPDIDAYQQAFPNHHLFPFITKTKNTLKTTTFISPHAVVFGSEGAGLPKHYGSIGTPVTIPISSKLDSLNLAVAVGIALNHINEQ